MLGLRTRRFEVRSRWFSGSADLRTYELDELLATKLRALYQRRKGRDLFDLALALGGGGASSERIVEVFARYMSEEGARVTRAMFERNLAEKRRDRARGPGLYSVIFNGLERRLSRTASAFRAKSRSSR